MSKTVNNDAIEIVTVYTSTEAVTYLADEFVKDPDTATVIKRVNYKKSPVIKSKPTQKGE